MKHHQVESRGGVRLHVVETGRRGRKAILFLHGFSQCWLSWSRQLNSDLADDFHLVALDLRGHGLSDKPREGYGESTAWADDVDAVIRALRLDRPILCAWSYGLVALDYLRHYGDDAIGGLNLVGAISKLGTEDATAVITPEFLALVPGFFATDAEASLSSLQALLRMCFVEPPAEQDFYLMLGYNVCVPPHVRQALFSRSVDNDDVLREIRKPVLITHGAQDAIVKTAAAERHAALLRHARTDLIENAGHAPFWDDAPAYHRTLRSFIETVD